MELSPPWLMRNLRMGLLLLLSRSPPELFVIETVEMGQHVVVGRTAGRDHRVIDTHCVGACPYTKFYSSQQGKCFCRTYAFIAFHELAAVHAGYVGYVVIVVVEYFAAELDNVLPLYSRPENDCHEFGVGKSLYSLFDCLFPWQLVLGNHGVIYLCGEEFPR